MNRLLSAAAVVLLLTACSGATTPAEPAAATTPAVPAIAATPADAAPADAQTHGYGYYSNGDTRIELRDVVWLPGAPGEVALLLAPTVLSPEEREAISAPGPFPGMPLLSKRVDEYGDRYPFVVVKLTIEEAGGVSQVRNYYVMAQAIREANHTDNLNGFPNDKNVVQWDVSEDGTRRLRFSGEEEFDDSVRRWEIDVAG